MPKSYPVGTVRTWENGKKYKKTANGWVEYSRSGGSKPTQKGHPTEYLAKIQSPSNKKVVTYIISATPHEKFKNMMRTKEVVFGREKANKGRGKTVGIKRVERDNLREKDELDRLISQSGITKSLPYPEIDQRFGFRKSFSAKLATKYPNGKWVTIKEGPLAGRHLFLSPHADGKTASVIVGGGPAMKHKKITLGGKKKAKPEAETETVRSANTPDEKGKRTDDEPTKQEKKEKRDEFKQKVKTQEKELHKVIEQKTGMDSLGDRINKLKEDYEKKKKEKKEDKEKLTKELTEELKKVKQEHGERVESIIETAKAVVLGKEQDEKTPDDSLHSQIADHAEEILKHHYALEKNKRQLRHYNQIVKPDQKGKIQQPMSFKFDDISDTDLKKMVMDEDASMEAIDAHHKLITEVYGGIDKDGNVVEPKGDKQLGRSVRQGGFEAMTAVSATLTGNSIIDKELFDELGAGNAAKLMTHYAQTSDKDLGKYLKQADKKFGDVAKRAIAEGDKFMQRAQDAAHSMADVFEAATASAFRLQFARKAKEAYGQAEGALNFVAEVAAAAKDGSKPPIVLKAGSQDTLMNKVKKFGLTDGDYTMKKDDTVDPGFNVSLPEGGKRDLNALAKKLKLKKDEFKIEPTGDGKTYRLNIQTDQSKDKMKDKIKSAGIEGAKVSDAQPHTLEIKPEAFEKLIKEKPIRSDAGNNIAGNDNMTDVERIKAGKDNTDDFKPSMLKDKFVAGTNKDGSVIMQDVRPFEHQQIAARLVENQERVYLNHEAGTGKTLTYVTAIAHVQDTQGRPIKSLVSMPSKLMRNFKQDVEKFSNFKVRIVDGSPAKRQEMYANVEPNTIYVINKEKFRGDLDLEHIKNAGFDMVINDEAHRLTSRNSKESDMFKGLQEVAGNAEYYIAGTGTPTPNDLTELYSQLKIMRPDKFTNQAAFMKKYGNLHKGAGFKDELKNILNTELNDQVYTKKKKIEGVKMNLNVHHAELSDTQKTRYKKVYQGSKKRQKGGEGISENKKKSAALKRDQVIGKILNETHHANNPKFNKIKSIVDQHLASKDPNEKISFKVTTYKERDNLVDFLKTHYPEYDHVQFTGEESVAAADKNKENYQTKPKIKFSIHTEAGVEGLNIQYDDENRGGSTTVIALASGADGYSSIDQFFSRGYRNGAKKDVDGHIILTNTPYDYRTETRLEDKKGIGNLVDNAQKLDNYGLMRKSLLRLIPNYKQHRQDQAPTRSRQPILRLVW